MLSNKRSLDSFCFSLPKGRARIHTTTVPSRNMQRGERFQ